jgi:hypothetical protein
MDRTVPNIGSEEIELYIRTYYSLLRSTHPIQLQTLAESHMGMESSLHIKARGPEPDVSALIYASLRLPFCIAEINKVLLGQSEEVFIGAGYKDIVSWMRVAARGRRRRMQYDGRDVLAVYIASRSDIDDLIPTLTAFQIEWNKLHSILQQPGIHRYVTAEIGDSALTDGDYDHLAAGLQMSLDDVLRLHAVWGEHFVPTLRAIAAFQKNILFQLLSGSLAHYRKATNRWWNHLADRGLGAGVDFAQRPVYFVSSNTHAIPNILTGFAWRHEAEMLGYLSASGHNEIKAEYDAICAEQAPSNHNNLLYYILKKYVQDAGEDLRNRVAEAESEIRLVRIPSDRGFDVEAQFVELRHLRPEWLDYRTRLAGVEKLRKSDAILVNIDYPLGMAAYDLLNEVAYQVGEILGVYVMGKAASLNARVGDVMLPNVVHDEHSQNTYLFGNCFTAADVAAFTTYGSVLDNQKALSARGTFLQNPRYMDVFYREGYTDIEMEAGPYLSAIYEAVRPKRHPYNEIVTLYGTPFDVGFLHYASDTPMSKGKNLGAGSLSYAGVDPTYAAALAIVRRVLEREIGRLR